MFRISGVLISILTIASLLFLGYTQHEKAVDNLKKEAFQRGVSETEEKYKAIARESFNKAIGIRHYAEILSQQGAVSSTTNDTGMQPSKKQNSPFCRDC